jgi:hypothetical protein
VKGKPPRRNPRRQTESDDSEEDISADGPITVSVPRRENRPPDQRTPNGRIEPETPESEAISREARRQLRADPDFAPSGSPLSRLKLRTTRDEPPQTRTRARLHAVTDEVH